MTAVELREWWIYYQVEPFGATRGDLQMAISTASMVNMWVKSSANVKIDDFLPDFYGAYRLQVRAPETSKQTQRAFTLMTTLVGGTVIQNGDHTITSD